MMYKSISVSVLCAALAVGSITSDVSARHKKHSGEVAGAIAGVIALGILGAAVGRHQRDNDTYESHPSLHPDENAVGTCMHHTIRTVKKAGGHYAQLDNVDRVETKPNGNTVVVFHATGFYDFGSKQSRVRCVIKNHRVTKFKYN